MQLQDEFVTFARFPAELQDMAGLRRFEPPPANTFRYFNISDVMATKVPEPLDCSTTLTTTTENSLTTDIGTTMNSVKMSTTTTTTTTTLILSTTKLLSTTKTMIGDENSSSAGLF
jgi:hypothetical protein